MNKRRTIILLLATLLLGAGSWLGLRRELREPLPDGSSFELHAVTRGTNHMARWRSKWRSVRNVLPTVLARRIAPPLAGQIVTSTNALIVWFMTDVAATRFTHLGSFYECTLLDADTNPLAVDSLNEIVGAQLYGDGQRLCYAIFPPVPRGAVTVRIQQRRVNADDTITFQSPAPPGAGLSGARLNSAGALNFKVPR